MYQLPNDIVGKGYIETKPFHHEQVFYSPSLDFEGTEKDFIANGHGYKYVQVGKHTRRII